MKRSNCFDHFFERDHVIRLRQVSKKAWPCRVAGFGDFNFLLGPLGLSNKCTPKMMGDRRLPVSDGRGTACKLISLEVRAVWVCLGI